MRSHNLQACMRPFAKFCCVPREDLGVRLRAATTGSVERYWELFSGCGLRWTRLMDSWTRLMDSWTRLMDKVFQRDHPGTSRQTYSWLAANHSTFAKYLCFDPEQ
jgi:hypothetical protein